jgi:hypothetical protein
MLQWAARMAGAGVGEGGQYFFSSYGTDSNSAHLAARQSDESVWVRVIQKLGGEKQKRVCGCWDSSPGLHGHNVEFSPLNYSHNC